jgi:hypothetical protein
LPALFALDQNFPEPIVQALNEYLPDGELVPLRLIDPLLTADMDDWQILLALHHHERPWDGMVTNDTRILNLPREIAVLRQTNMTLVVAEDSGHDPIRATGLLFTHLSYIARETTPDRPQIWKLVARDRPGGDPWDFLQRIAGHRNMSVDSLWRDSRLTRAELGADPLAL